MSNLQDGVRPTRTVPVMKGPLVLKGPGLADPALVGNKFARLELMRQAGLPVPAFFCLTAVAFDDALAGVSRQLPAIEAGQEPARAWCQAAADALRHTVVPAGLADQVLAAVDERIGPAGLVAVRACVVPAADTPGEDSALDPFAGMSESHLYVPRENVLSLIPACWSSAFTPQGVRYRQWRGMDPARARVAVGIQEMVQGTRSFVAFTRDPRDGARHTVIAAAHGIGEGVVAEKADIDHFFVEAGQVRAETVCKRRMVSLPQAGGRPAVLDVPEHLADAPVLTDGEARAIAAFAADAEELFGTPQDVEGVITADGAIYLVQARPIVGTENAPSGEPLYWANHNITESYPGVTGALTYSLAQEFYRRSFGDMYHRVGVPRRRFDANRHHLEQMVAYLDGRVYYRLDAWYALHGQLPAFDLVRPLWEQAMGVTGASRQPRQWPKIRAALAVPGLLIRAARHPRQIRGFLHWWDDLYRSAGDLADQSPAELVAFYRRLWAQVGVRWGVTLTNSMYGMLLGGLATVLARRWAGADGTAIAGLLAGGRENRSLGAVRSAIALAEQITAAPELRNAVLRAGTPGAADVRQVWDDLTRGRYGASLAQAGTDYVRRYGDRALHDLKLEEPTPRQRPWMVLDVVRPFLEQGLSVEASRAAERQAVHQASAGLKKLCPNPVRRGVLRMLAAGVRASIRAREDTRFCRTQLFGLSRQVMWRLGEELAAEGLLADTLDVRDLTVHEVLGAFDGTLPGSDLHGLAAHRRAERERYAAAPPRHSLLATAADRPLPVALRTAVPVDQPARGSEATLRGLGSSGGVVRGRARVVLEPTVDAASCNDSILVARETDPGWLFLMMVCKGLVVERGTLLSHTAITGRLLGVPTVVGVAGATARIADGGWIEIDGSTGTVTLLEEIR